MKYRIYQLIGDFTTAPLLHYSLVVTSLFKGKEFDSVEQAHQAIIKSDWKEEDGLLTIIPHVAVYN